MPGHQLGVDGAALRNGNVVEGMQRAETGGQCDAGEHGVGELFRYHAER